jgi:hypothetical protein
MIASDWQGVGQILSHCGLKPYVAAYSGFYCLFLTI